MVGKSVYRPPIYPCLHVYAMHSAYPMRIMSRVSRLVKRYWPIETYDPPGTEVSVFASCRTSANIPFGRFITAPVSVLWRPILKFSPHLADYSSKNQFPRKSSRTRECRGHVIFLREYMVEETNPVFSPPFFYYFDQPGRVHKRKNSRENFPNGRRMKFLRYA